MPRADPLVEQPVVTHRHVVDRAGMDVLRRAPVIDDQRAAADGLGDMGIDLAVRVHRAGDIAAAMRAKQHAVLCAAFRHCPHGGNAAGIGLDIIDAARFAGDVPHCSNMCRNSSSGISGLAFSAATTPGKACSAPRPACLPCLPPPGPRRAARQFAPGRAPLRGPNRARASAAQLCRRIRARAPASPPRRRSAFAPRSPWHRSRRARTSP